APLVPPRPERSPPLCSKHSRAQRPLHSFPTRRSSDLAQDSGGWRRRTDRFAACVTAIQEWQAQYTTDRYVQASEEDLAQYLFARDRKSTRLNSSHVSISYAVFCLKKQSNITSKRKSLE